MLQTEKFVNYCNYLDVNISQTLPYALTMSQKYPQQKKLRTQFLRSMFTKNTENISLHNTPSQNTPTQEEQDLTDMVDYVYEKELLHHFFSAINKKSLPSEFMGFSLPTKTFCERDSFLISFLLWNLHQDCRLFCSKNASATPNTKQPLSRNLLIQQNTR